MVVKPHLVRGAATTSVMMMIADAGLEVVSGKNMRMSQAQAEELYASHCKVPFF